MVHILVLQIYFYPIALEAGRPCGPQIFQEHHYFLNCLKRGCRLLGCLLLLLYSKYIISSAPDMDAIEPWRRDTIDVWKWMQTKELSYNDLQSLLCLSVQLCARCDWWILRAVLYCTARYASFLSFSASFINLRGMINILLTSFSRPVL